MRGRKTKSYSCTPGFDGKDSTCDNLDNGSNDKRVSWQMQVETYHPLLTIPLDCVQWHTMDHEAWAFQEWKRIMNKGTNEIMRKWTVGGGERRIRKKKKFRQMRQIGFAFLSQTFALGLFIDRLRSLKNGSPLSPIRLPLSPQQVSPPLNTYSTWPKMSPMLAQILPASNGL